MEEGKVYMKEGKAVDCIKKGRLEKAGILREEEKGEERLARKER